MDVWNGRVDSVDDPEALRWHQVVRPSGSDLPAGVVFVGFASDEGIRRNGGRPGAVEGPTALRRTLSNLPLVTAVPLYDGGDISCDDGDLEGAQLRYSQRIAGLLDNGHFPVGLGGGHEIGFASYLGLASSHFSRGKRVAIVNLDAHFDLRDAPEANSGTPFLQAIRHARDHGIPLDYICLGVSESANTRRLFTTAAETGSRYIVDRELGGTTAASSIALLRHWLEPAEVIYLSVCLDVLPAWEAPGVSAPSARGVALGVVEELIAAVVATGRLALCDVAELSPAFDRDNATARVAARIVHRMAMPHR